jgi:hypothetical protein
MGRRRSRAWPRLWNWTSAAAFSALQHLAVGLGVLIGLPPSWSPEGGRSEPKTTAAPDGRYRPGAPLTPREARNWAALVRSLRTPANGG